MSGLKLIQADSYLNKFRDALGVVFKMMSFRQHLLELFAKTSLMALDWKIRFHGEDEYGRGGVVLSFKGLLELV
jgi:hypothetical protein